MKRSSKEFPNLKAQIQEIINDLSQENPWLPTSKDLD